MNDLPIDAERMLALSYAPAAPRAALQTLFALDDKLAGILRTTREPLVGQMRLTWWHAALIALDAAPPPAEPVLRALADAILPRGVTGARLATMIDAWEVLLDGEIADSATLDAHAARGVILFGAMATVLGVSAGDPVAPAGRGWALADLGRHVQDRAVATRALALAAAPLAAATGVRWSRAGRTIGALAHLARMDLAVPVGQPVPHGSPRRVARLLMHRLWGH